MKPLVLRRPMPVGMRVGGWTVIGEPYRIGRRAFVRCRCGCGAEQPVLIEWLRTGQAQGCMACAAIRRTKHGGYRGNKPSPEYYSWAAMRRRCADPKNASYARYGGRGIIVCERWRTSFADFLADMGSKPTPKHQIDRINSDRNYEPGNCRWATAAEQSRNVCTNRILTLNGRSMTQKDWAEELGMNQQTLAKRLRSGWSAERALTAPIEDRKSHARKSE